MQAPRPKPGRTACAKCRRHLIYWARHANPSGWGGMAILLPKCRPQKKSHSSTGTGTGAGGTGAGKKKRALRSESTISQICRRFHWFRAIWMHMEWCKGPRGPSVSMQCRHFIIVETLYKIICFYTFFRNCVFHRKRVKRHFFEHATSSNMSRHHDRWQCVWIYVGISWLLQRSTK